MNRELDYHANRIIECADALLKDGELNMWKLKFVRIIYINAERFMQVCKELQETTPAEFHAAIRHDLATPLTPMRGYSDLLMMNIAGVLSPQQYTHVQQICESCHALRHLIEVAYLQAKV